MNIETKELEELLHNIEILNNSKKSKKIIKKNKNDENIQYLECIKDLKDYIILSIDPSLIGTGYAVFNHQQSILAYGEISTNNKSSIEERLYNIYNNLKSIINSYSPNVIIIEKMFLNMNGKTSMNIAAVRGIVLLLCGEFKIKNIEIIATTVRKIVIGSGKAIKEQIRDFILNILSNNNIYLDNPSHNIIDAIAVGMYFFKILELN